jgi:hypothetical protein
MPLPRTVKPECRVSTTQAPPYPMSVSRARSSSSPNSPATAARPAAGRDASSVDAVGRITHATHGARAVVGRHQCRASSARATRLVRIGQSPSSAASAR